MGHAEVFCRSHSAMTGENCDVVADKNRVREAESRDTVRNLADLALAVGSRIARIRM